VTASSPGFPGLSFRHSRPELDHWESRPSIRPTRPTLPSATPPQKPRHRGVGRFALGIAAGLGLSVTFVGAFAAALLLHLNAPSARRAIAAEVSDLISKDLRGRVDIVSIDRISPRGMDIGEATVRDPQGKPVISAYGAHVRYNVLGLATAFLRKGTPTIDRVVVERVNVALIPTLADAFASKNPTPPKGPGEKTPSTFRLAAPAIDIRMIEAWGQAGDRWITAYGEVEKASVLVTPDATWVNAPRISANVPEGRVDIDGALHVPNHVTVGDLPVVVDRLHVLASAGGTHAIIDGSSNQRELVVHVEAPSVSPETIATLTGEPPPIMAPASVSLDVRADVERATIHGIAGIGAGTASIDGNIEYNPFESDVSVAMRGVDPALFGGPSLGLSTDLAVHARKIGQAMALTVKGSAGTMLGGKAGKLDIDAEALIAKNAVRATGKLKGDLGRAHANVEFSLEQHGKEGTAHASVAARVPELAELRALHQQPIRGRVDLEGAVDVDLGKQTFALNARAHAIGFSHPSVRLPEGAIAVQAEGPFAEPKFVTAVVARQIVLSPSAPNPYRLHNVDMRVVGTRKLIGVSGKLSTDAGQNVTVDTHVAPTATGARIVGTKLRVVRDTFVAEIAVGELSLDGPRAEIKGLKMSSTAGGLRLDAVYDPKRSKISVDIASTPLDIPALMHGAGLEDLGLRGTVTIDTKLATIPRKNPANGTESGILRLNDDVARKVVVPTVTTPYLAGHLKLDVDGGYAPQVGDLNAHVNVDVEDRWVGGDVGLAIKDLIRVGLHGSALVPGRIDDPKQWANASGHVDLRIPQVKLEKVSAFFAKRGVQLPAMVGLVDIDGHLERRGKDAPPTGFLTIDTHGFAMQSGATRIDGVDLRLRAAIDGTKNEDGTLSAKDPVRIYAVAEAHDQKGPIAIVHGGTEGLWSKLATGQIADLPIVFNAIVAPRSLEEWPRAIAKMIPVRGKLGLVAHGEGTVAAPKIDLRARLEEVSDASGGVHDAEVTLTYDGALAKLLASVTPRTEPTRKELLLDGEVKVRSIDLASGGNVPWSAKLDAKLDGLPLDLLVSDTGIGGKANGEIHANHINDPAAKAATVDGRIDVDGFRVGETLFDETFLTVKVDEQAANATVAIHGKDGNVDGHVTVPLTWKSSSTPTVGGKIDAALDAKDLRLKIVEPFVTAVDKLDGRVDAHITTNNGSPEGTLKLRDGVIIADAVGERWDHVTAEVTMHDNKITLPSLELRGRTGGYAKISGHATLENFFPKAFHSDIVTKRFSFASEGAKVGDLTGKIVIDGKTVTLADKREQMVIDVTLDPLTIDLAAEAGKQVQSLDEDPSIVLMQPNGPPVKPPRPPGTGTSVKVVVHIPHNVMVRRDDLRIAANGNPSVEIDGPAKYSGEVRIDANPASTLLQRSWVEVQGKRFYIQQSRIAFAGNEDFDPLVDVEVRWQAPDRTIVQVRITGHLQTPKVTFRALDESGAPLGLTQGEVMSLIVLGRRDAGSAQQQQAAEKGAASTTASLVQGMTGAVLGRQLQKMLPASMSLSLAPGRYSGGYQHKNVYFEVAYNSAGARMGPQAIGQTVPRMTFGIEWRFAKMWSLMTTVGDTGSTLVDLLWHYRY
jgi:hypothetical protein